MEVHELTEEEREQMTDELFKKLSIQRKHPSKEELEKEIIDYLSKKHPCCLATCGKDGVPRTSVVDYINDGLIIYIFSEGGKKFKNIKDNPKVSIGIGTSTQTIKSVRGVNIEGIAEVFTEDIEAFAYAMKLFRTLFEDFETQIGGPVKFPPGMMRVIRVTPYKMVYYHYNQGIANASWEANG
jgi:nitroimidazol reductase NimA-like FMN-containing flavoprotein (pyridoxamine 5'-phosphate oxidase superfamily)